MVNEMSIVSTLGTIPLVTGEDSFTVSRYELAGATGLGLTDDSFVWAESPGGGGRVKSVRTMMRAGSLSIRVVATSRAESDQMLRTLGQHLKPHRNPELRFNHPVHGMLRLPFKRVGGGGDWWDEGFVESTVLTFSIQCPGSYWQAVAATTANVAAGSVTLTNVGDAPAAVTWTFTGPIVAGTLTVRRNGASLFVLTVPALASPRKVVVSLGPAGWGVEMVNGAVVTNAFPYVTGVALFPYAEPGATTFTVTGSGVVPATTVSINPRYEGVK